MKNPNSATEAETSPENETQEKTVEIYFGVFIDVLEVDHWINTLGNYRKKGEKWKEDMESDIMDSKYGKVAMIAEGTANTLAKLPNNPVSNAIQKGLDVKDKIVGYKDKVEGYMDKADGFVDNTLGKIMDSDFVNVDENVDATGSKRSMISKMEPAYVGGLFVGDDFWSDYNYRIYLQGALFPGEINPKESKDGEADESIPEEARNQLSENAVKEALDGINQKLSPLQGQKLSVHFDLFGYAKDPTVDNLKSEIEKLKGDYPNINELAIDYTGKYNKFCDSVEVKSDLGDAMMRFRNLKFLEK